MSTSRIPEHIAAGHLRIACLFKQIEWVKEEIQKIREDKMDVNVRLDATDSTALIEAAPYSTPEIINILIVGKSF
jgi:hypothetical protein